jgi:hypothetical protein
MSMPTAETFVPTRGEGTLRGDQTAAQLHHDDDQSWPVKHGVGGRMPAQRTHAMANVRTTMGLVAGLLLVWVAIVAV